MAFRSLFEPKWVRFAIILSIGVILNGLYFFYDGVKIKDFVLNYHRVAPKNKTTFETCPDKFSTRTQPVTQNWQPVGNRSDIFVFSAYFNKEKKAVQVVGISLLQIKVECICTFTTSATTTTGSGNEDGKPVRGELEIIPENHGRRYSASIITCSVGNTSHPQTVTLRFQNNLGRNATLAIIYPSREKVQFTICFPAVHSNYMNKEELVQAISMNRILGAERFVLYNHSMSFTLQKVINFFVQKNVLDVIQWKIPVSQIHYVAQLAAIHDCFYRNRYTSKYIIFQDLDEYIIPKQFTEWDSMMRTLVTDHPLAGTFIFRHTFFPRYWPDTYLNTSDDKGIKEHKLYVLTKIVRHAQIMGWNKRSKFIVLPSRVKIIGIHHVPGHEPGFHETLVNQSVGLLHHYRGAAPDTAQRVMDPTARRFTGQLVAMVGSVWNCTGLT